MTDRHDQDIETLRAFNRVYTSRLGLLDASYDGSPFSLSEARVLYELATRTEPVAADIARALRLDPAQVSRTLKRFGERGLVATRENPAHGRHQLLSLTETGRTTYAELEAGTRGAVGRLLGELHPLQRARLLSAAAEINEVFAGDAPEVVLRGLRPGDLGAVAARQAILYTTEYDWDAGYEALAARILADFHDGCDPLQDDAWIAEVAGRMVGSIFLVRGAEPKVAKLRLLYVEPDARGLGIGGQLIATCIERARALGYERMDLWTVSVLTAARKLYERAGFRVVETEPVHRFGHALTDETWSLDLRT